MYSQWKKEVGENPWKRRDLPVNEGHGILSGGETWGHGFNCTANRVRAQRLKLSRHDP